MSEYQYHEWQCVDRLLTLEEQAAVESLSSHMDATPSRAIVTYEWSDFRHDPKQVLERYFDGYFYQATWGTLRLMFRFPEGLLEEAEILPYLSESHIAFETLGRHHVLDLDFELEGGEVATESTGGLSLFIRLREDLIAGDYRLLYLAWLKAASSGQACEPAEHEPPVPPGLRKLSPPLQNFAEIFGVDPFLIQAAAECSEEPQVRPARDYRRSIRLLSQSECEDFLLRLARGDPGASYALRKRLGAGSSQGLAPAAKLRTISELSRRARRLERAEQERRAEEARKEHLAEMNSLAAREMELWQEIDLLLEEGRRIASTYDGATGVLEKLEQLSDFQHRRPEFCARMRQLAEKYASRPALIQRWKKRGWV